MTPAWTPDHRLRNMVNSGAKIRELPIGSNMLPIATSYYVDPTNGSDTQDGKSWERAFLTLTQGLSVMVSWDTLYLAPGGYTGNFATPLNSVAPFCSLIGVNATDRGFGPWMSATVASTPILEIKARGWRISGIEFDCPTGAAGLKLTTSGTSNANYAQVDNCLFTGGAGTGKYGIDFSGAPTYVKIIDNIFDGFGAASCSALWCSDSGTDVPRACLIEHNEFMNSVGHIAMNPRGFKGSVISHNFFQRVGMNRTATTVLDVRGGGKNAIVGNYLGVANGTAANGYDHATGPCRGESDDFWSGNYLDDGLTDTNPAGGA